MIPAAIGPYRIVDRLATGGMGVVYRAEDARTGAALAVKTVRLVDVAQLGSIRREIHALGRVRHPGVVRIFDEGVSQGEPWYAMELLEGTPLGSARLGRGVASGPQRQDVTRLRDVLTLVRRICVPLAYVHGEGIVHRDLKPENVFLRRGGTPVLVDFGLASRFGAGGGRESLDVAGTFQGTVGYVAPEQMRGELVDARADLYALGCILYELLVGEPPFVGAPWDVAAQHLRDEPVPPSKRASGIPAELDDLVLRLLAKRPRDRIGYAEDVARVLATLGADGWPHERDVPPSRPFLYRPAFSGRDDVLAIVSDRLRSASGGSGSFVLLGGESGAGKTRVAMEIATEAARLGFRVVSGECLPVAASSSGSTAGAPLHAFRPLLQAAADRCVAAGVEETDRVFGRRAKVLALYEPTLVQLPGAADHPDPPIVSAQAARERVLDALGEATIALAEERPLLLVIDDLQWADELSAGFLARIAASLRESPIVVLGTFRREELGGDVAKLLGSRDVVHLELERLSPAVVGHIVADMLALEAPPASLVGSLATHAAGNPFFVAECLRSAVDERLLSRDDLGRWRVTDGGVVAASFPIPGSLRDVVGRRLRGLGAIARVLAEVGSVLGREVDVELLATVASIGEVELMEGLEELLARCVLEEVGPGRFRFAHDKLRELSYERLDAARTKELHLRAGEALELLHADRPDFPLEWPIVAHHFERAGARDEALEYLEKAGEHALRTGAHGEAASHLRRALALSPPEGERRARLLRDLGDALWGLGDLAGCIEQTSSALATLGDPLPATDLGWALAFGRELARQSFHLVLRDRVVTPDAAARRALADAAIAASRMSQSYYFSESTGRMVVASLVAVNRAERGGSTAEVSKAYALLGIVAGVAKLERVARGYFARARAAGERSHDPVGAANGHYMEAVLDLGLARFRAVEARAGEALALLADAGDRNETELVETILAHAEYFTGRFEASRRRFEGVLDSARARANAQHEAWGLYAMARSLLPLGRTDEALSLVEEARGLLVTQADHASDLICDGLSALGHLARGDFGVARGAAKAIAARTRGAMPSVFSTIHGYLGAAEVWLASLERADVPRDEALRAATAACRQLRTFARIFPLGSPSSIRCDARLDAALGRRERARRGLLKSAALGRTLGMPYETALAERDLARLGFGAEHRTRAIVILQELGCERAEEAVGPLRHERCTPARLRRHRHVVARLDRHRSRGRDRRERRRRTPG